MKKSITIWMVIFCFPLAALSQKGYQPYDEMTREISSLVLKHKDISKFESIGKTWENRDIWCVTICRKDPDSNHAVLIVGGVDAVSLISSELTIRFLAFILNSYGKADSITNLVNSTTFYIIPRLNPDASEAFFKKPLYVRTVNARRVDDDKDGLTDEDGYEDLNSDGLITMMRVKDNRGEWLPHTADSRIMKKADPSKNEKGIYKLFTEGIDNDKDEQWNEDEPGGVDINRNFSFGYQFFSRGAGPHQVSEPESRAVVDFCFGHPNITVVFTFALNDNLMNSWKKEIKQGLPQQTEQPRRGRIIFDDEETPHAITSVMDDDEQYFSFISRQYQEMTKLKNPPPTAKGEGAFSEWAYYHFGRWSFGANPWWIPEAGADKDSERDIIKMKTPGEKNKPRSEVKFDVKTGKGPEERPDPYDYQIRALKWLDANNIPDGFVQWTKIKHPDFPDNEVEVGGFKPFVLTNPPAESIKTIAEYQNNFLVWLASKLPALTIRNIKVEPIGGKVFRVKAAVSNVGYFPTNSAMGNKVRWPRNVKISVALGKDQTLASGKALTILNPIKGNGGYQEMSWSIVSNSGASVQITAECPMAGRVTKTIELK